MRLRKDTSIAIIGAGIGGLALVAALRQTGIDAEVYEQAEKFARIGAGIQQSPNAMKVHRGLGIEARLRDTAFAPVTSLNRDAITGAVTNDHPLGRPVEQRYGAPYLTLHRGDLHAALAEIVPADSVHRGKKLVRIAEEGTRIALGFADGSEVEADAVIGADGVHSLVREHVGITDRPRRLPHDLSGGAPEGCRSRSLAHQVVGARPPHRHLLRHRGARRGLFR